MRSIGSVCPSVIILALAVLVTASSALGGNSGFVSVSGTQFMLRGRPIFPTGTNSYYQMTYRRWQAPGPDEVLDKVQARQMTLVRTCAFQDAEEIGACLQCAPARQLQPNERPADFIDAETLVALDQTLAAADARGIRLILTLVNNWTDYGGMDRWTLWRFGTVQHDSFYSDTTIRGWYRDLASILVNRVNTVNGRIYRDDPTIFAWELANEARSSSGAAASLDAWVGEMSAHLKSIDPNHLVTTGIEGFYGPAYADRNTDTWMSQAGHDFISNHQHAGIDFATCHIWPYNWGWEPIGNTQSALNKAAQYLQQRLTDAETVLHMPLLCEEFGIPRDNMGRGLGSGATTIRDLFYQQVYYGLCESSALFGGACGGATNWLILHDGYSPYDDGYGVFLPSDVSTDVVMSADAAYMARLRRGDLDFDGDVDQSDFGVLQACLTGTTSDFPQPSCRNADMDNDGHVDEGDVAVFTLCVNGSNVTPDPVCVYDGMP